jgi:hypothetical protein
MLIGAVHLDPLPGSPRWGGDMDAVVRNARQDTDAFVNAGFDGVMFENFNDVPFEPTSSMTTVAAMTAVITRAADGLAIPFGVNVLRNGAEAAVTIATATGAKFIRANVYVYAAVCDQGTVNGCADRVQRLKRLLDSDVKVYADVHVKHARSLAPSLEDEARDAVDRGLANALIVSGPATGAPPDTNDLDRVRGVVDVPVLIGSGATVHTASDLLGHADGVIVASALKRGGRVDPDLATAFERAARGRA